MLGFMRKPLEIDVRVHEETLGVDKERERTTSWMFTGRLLV
jgi:hypothetical protein